jgi:hypothetical protein
VIHADGDGLDDATDAIEAGGVVDLGSVNTRPIADNSAHPQDKTADSIVGQPLRTRFDAAMTAVSALAELFPKTFLERPLPDWWDEPIPPPRKPASKKGR